MERPMERERHGCLTAWLILIIVVALFGLGGSFFRSAAANQALANLPAWWTPVGTVLSLLKLACVAALFTWKRVGFWGLCVLAFVQAGMAQMASSQIANMMPQGGPAAPFLKFFSHVGVALPLVALAILYGVLQIGGPKKAWTQLE